MRRGWKFALVLVLTTVLCLQCAKSKKTKTKLLRKLWNIGHPKAAHQKTLTGQKKNAVHPSMDQVAAMQNPESLQPSEAEELNQLQNYNKQYINNEMAAETALLADQGIDDDSALKISNMAALPNGMPPGANPAIKAKISSSSAAHAPKETSTDPSQASPGGYDPNAYLYDANSWPEYTIHDSDYSNFRSVEMNNMNGENTDMPNYEKINGRRPAMPGFQSMENEGEEEFQGPKFSHEKSDSTQFNDEVKQEHGDEPQKKPPSKGNQADKVNNEGADSGTKGVSKSDSNSKPAPGSAQQPPQAPAVVKAVNNAPAAKDASSQKQPQPAPKAAPAKLDASVAQMAASLPPKAIASLVSRLVGNGKAVGAAVGQVQGQHQGQGQGQGQIQKNVAGTVSQAPIPQDINPAEELSQAATQLQKVTKPKKH